MSELLVLIGIPESISTALVGMGIPMEYLFLLGVCFLFFKFLVIPKTKLFLDKANTRVDDIVNKLNDISTKLDNSNDRAMRIERIINELSHDKIGSTDFNLAISTFALILDKMHLKALSHFQYRCRVNHFVNNEAIIRSRYSNVSTDLASKSFAQLGKYFYNGLPLSQFYSNGGLDSYCRHLNAELFDLQGLKAIGDSSVLSVTENDVEAGLDRLLETQLILFKDWLNTQNDTTIYINRKNEFPVKVIDNAILE